MLLHLDYNQTEMLLPNYASILVMHK